MTGELDAATARDALEAAWEALTIPHAATLGDEQIRTAILLRRVMHAVVCLDQILGKDGRGPVRDPEFSVAYLREKLAENPATGYRTWDERAGAAHM